MARPRPFAALLASAAIACNALTGVGELGLQDEVGAGAPDASIAVATTVDGGTDGTPGGDSSIIVTDDATVDADASPPLGFCASLSPAPTLCRDFDDNVLAPWTSSTTGLGAAAIDTTQSRSAPRGLRVALPSGSGKAYVSHSFGGNAPSTITLAFSVRADAVATDFSQELAVIFLAASGGNPYQLQLEMLPNGTLSVEEETPASDGTIAERDIALGMTIPLSAWRRITWTISIGATSSTTAVAVEGFATPASFGVDAHAFKAAPTMNLGHDGTVATPFTVYYDDVVVDLK